MTDPLLTELRRVAVTTMAESLTGTWVGLIESTVCRANENGYNTKWVWSAEEREPWNRSEDEAMVLVGHRRWPVGHGETPTWSCFDK